MLITRDMNRVFYNVCLKPIFLLIIILDLSICVFAETTPTITLKQKCDENNNLEKTDTVFVWAEKDALRVSHRNTLHNCCSNYSPVLKRQNDTLLLYYKNNSDLACICQCNFTLDYTIKNLPFQRYFLVLANMEGNVPVTGCSAYVDYGNFTDTILLEEMPQMVGVDTLFVYDGDDVDIMPTFRPKGLEKNNDLREYIKEFQGVTDTLANDASLLIKFIVERDGSISNVEIVRSCGLEDIDKDAVALIESMPKWIPGKRAGCDVRVRKYLHIDYRRKLNNHKNNKQ